MVGSMGYPAGRFLHPKGGRALAVELGAKCGHSQPEAGQGYQGAAETSFLQKMRRAQGVAVMIYLLLGLFGGPNADEENKKTIVSFNPLHAIPGGQALPASKADF